MKLTRFTGTGKAMLCFWKYDGDLEDQGSCRLLYVYVLHLGVGKMGCLIGSTVSFAWVSHALLETVFQIYLLSLREKHIET
jgi:hypothetical protein